VLRFWNDEVLKNLDGVAQAILEAWENKTREMALEGVHYAN